jgi:SAM-dependent methyltransferase
MDVPEIEQMALLERDHWWYRGLRDAIRRTLKQPRFRIRPGGQVLDAGCGTGENLRMLVDLLAPSYAGGFDLSEHAVNWTRRKVGESADVYVSDIRDPQVHVADLDLVLSCDVISIPGVEASKVGLARLIDRLRVGGLFIHNMAAYQWLYSSHDVITHTQQRTNVRQMKRLMHELGMSIELITYRVFWLFPAILAARLPSMIRRPSLQTAHSDLEPVHPLLNRGLGAVMKVENAMMKAGLRYPWGSSVFVVARKRS